MPFYNHKINLLFKRKFNLLKMFYDWEKLVCKDKTVKNCESSHKRTIAYSKKIERSLEEACLCCYLCFIGEQKG